MPKFYWRHFEGIGYCLIYEGKLTDEFDFEGGTPVAMIKEQSDHYHVLSPLTFLNKGCKTAREAMEHVQDALQAWAKMVSDTPVQQATGLWPVVG